VFVTLFELNINPCLAGRYPYDSSIGMDSAGNLFLMLGMNETNIGSYPLLFRYWFCMNSDQAAARIFHSRWRALVEGISAHQTGLLSLLPLFLSLNICVFHASAVDEIIAAVSFLCGWFVFFQNYIDELFVSLFCLFF